VYARIGLRIFFHISTAYLELNENVTNAAPGSFHGGRSLNSTALRAPIDPSQGTYTNALLKIDLAEDSSGPCVVPVWVVRRQFFPNSGLNNVGPLGYFKVILGLQMCGIGYNEVLGLDVPDSHSATHRLIMLGRRNARVRTWWGEGWGEEGYGSHKHRHGRLRYV